MPFALVEGLTRMEGNFPGESSKSEIQCGYDACGDGSRLNGARGKETDTNIQCWEKPAILLGRTVDAVEWRQGKWTARAGASAVACVLAFCLLASCTARPPRISLPARAPAPNSIVPEWPRREVLDLALRAYQCGLHEGRFRRPRLTVIDYSLPAAQPRLWVIDLQRMSVMHHELVAHGERSGGPVAVAFSNEVGSHQSSIGLFRTDETYFGRFGYALRLSGLEPGINDRARERAIVMHGASDVSQAYISLYGTIGRSWGCPAVSQEVAPKIIDAIAGGSAVFAYYPDQDWLAHSRYLNCGEQRAVSLAPSSRETPTPGDHG